MYVRSTSLGKNEMFIMSYDSPPLVVIPVGKSKSSGF
jgi:hypothetical protein